MENLIYIYAIKFDFCQYIYIILFKNIENNFEH